MNKPTNINIIPKRGNSISRALNTATRRVRAFNTGNNKTMKGLKDTINSTFNKLKGNKEQSVSHKDVDVGLVEPNEEKGDGDAGTDTERLSRVAEALQQSKAARAGADQHLRNEEQLNKPRVQAATKLQAVQRGRMERNKQAVEKEAAHEVRKVWEAAGKSEEDQKMAEMAARAAWKRGKEAANAGKSQEEVQKVMMAAKMAYEQAHAVKDDDKEDVEINVDDGRHARVAVDKEEEEDDDKEDVEVHVGDGRKSRVAVVDKEEEEEEEEQEDSDDGKEKQAPVVKAVITGERVGAGVGLDEKQLADEEKRKKDVPDKEQLAEKEAWPVLDKDMADIEAHLEHDTRTRRPVDEAKRDEEKDALAELKKVADWDAARKKIADETVGKPVGKHVAGTPVKPAPKAGLPTPSGFTRKTIDTAIYGSKVANDWTLGLGEFKSKYKKIITKILNEKFTDDEQNKLLNYIIVYSNKKKSIRDILAFNISSIFSRGETSLNIYRQGNLKKNFNYTEDEEEGPKKGGAKQEEDEQTGGLGSYGFRNFDEEDAIKFTTLILNSLSELYKIDNPRDDDKLTNNQALLFEKYLKSLFGKVGPKTLNGLLPQIDNATIVSELVIQHFINRLKADNAAKEKNKDDKDKDDKDKVKDDKDKDDTPAKKLSQLNFSLKHNAAPFAAAIVDITLNTQELKGNEGEIENYLDRKYDIAMKKPHDEEKAHIANSQLRDVFKTIFGESISTINIYRENIRKMDEIIDTINDKNIKTKFKDIEKLLVFAKIDKGVITYKMPPKIIEKLELQPPDDTAEDKLARALALITELQNATTIDDVKSKVGASRLL